MIWWVICENLLRIGFRNEFFTFTSKNEVALDDLHILKIGFKNSWGMVWGKSWVKPQGMAWEMTQEIHQEMVWEMPQEMA